MMETLVVARHRNDHQYYSRKRSYSSSKFVSFGSPPLGSYRGINCRTFQSGEGLLPTPSEAYSTKTPFTEKMSPAPFSPKTPSPSLIESQKIPKRIVKSSTVAIPIKFKIDNTEGEFHFSERWAGPAYSNSPPPSSLPIPKFSQKPKRTVSLDLPNVASEINSHHISKSAPASPTRERSLSPCDPFGFSISATEMSIFPCESFDISDSGSEMSLSPCDSFDISVSATKTLRRILNLDD
ncbi:hypothetical protein OROMI_015824 [Orobanche minor]